MAVVYLHKRKDNKEVFYVGIGKTESRAYEKRKRSNFWENYTNKYEYFTEVLTKDISWEEACEIEKELICFYGRRDLGFGELINLTDGGEGSLGVIVSLETREKISRKSKGNKGSKYWLGKRHSEESKTKMRKVPKTSISKPVLQFDINGIFIREFKSIASAASSLNLHSTAISRVCIGKAKRKTTGGFIWKYKE